MRSEDEWAQMVRDGDELATWVELIAEESINPIERKNALQDLANWRELTDSIEARHKGEGE